MPAVAVTLNCVEPTGVDGDSIPDVLEQPAIKAMGTKVIATNRSSGRGLLLLLCRRKNASEPKGRSSASPTPVAARFPLKRLEARYSALGGLDGDSGGSGR